MPEYPHQHLKIPPNSRVLRFKGNGRGKFPRRNLSREQHAARLQTQIGDISTAFEEEQERRKETGDSEDFGLILNVKSAPGYELALDSLEKGATKHLDGIYLLNVRRTQTLEGEVMSAGILVPYGRLDVLAKKIDAYADESKDLERKDGTKSPRNADLLANIQSIGVAALEALWTDQEAIPSTDEAIWWELWVSRAPRAQDKEMSWRQLFDLKRESLGFEINDFRLLLPDNEIVLVKAKREELEGSIDLLNTLTEIRMARPCSLGLSELPGPEQSEWIADALTRIRWPEGDAPAVCLLDTGVNREHPLLRELIAENDLNSIVPQFGRADHPIPLYAHGTPMAGIAAYDDLRNLILPSENWGQLHRLESVKMIHNGNEHDPDNYGEVTRQAIILPEIDNDRRSRVYCMALTQSEVSDGGRPSSWSSAVDASAAGANEEEQPKRVIFISAGNLRNFLEYSYPGSNLAAQIENPAQSWNAITVGAMTKLITISESGDEANRARAIAGYEGMSPLSRTSEEWDPKWPIKPEIVCEGGNLATTESGEIVQRDSLEPISTASNFHSRPLCNMNATSAATASASRLGAMLMAKMPGFWAETYRGMIVHSANWSERMLGSANPFESGNSGAVQSLLRTCGFGIPNPERLFGSGESGVTMIIQDEIQPYDPDSKAGEAKLGYFNLHDLPWPRSVLEQYSDMDITLKATLSYFIEPNPGSRCWEKSKKYHYASHLLRFSFKRATESEDIFQRALERIEDEEADSSEKRAQSDPKWALGPKLRGKSGSLVQDLWKGSAAELMEMDKVAVFPAKGWFATRSFHEDHESHNCHQRKVRYSLILSLDAEQDIGLYTSVSNRVSVDV